MFFPRFVVSLAVIVALVFAIAVVLIRNQPFDDGDFHDKVFGDGCSTACLLGIQPGVTTVDQARSLLSQQGMVSQWIEPLEPVESFGILRWRWSSHRPMFLTETDASLSYDLKTGIVNTFGELPTRLTFGQMLIQLGQPSMSYWSAGYNDRGGAIFTSAIGYPQLGMIFVSEIQCPMTMQALWNAPVSLQVAPTGGQMARFSVYPVQPRTIVGYANDGFCT